MNGQKHNWKMPFHNKEKIHAPHHSEEGQQLNAIRIKDLLPLENSLDITIINKQIAAVTRGDIMKKE